MPWFHFFPQIGSPPFGYILTQTGMTSLPLSGVWDYTGIPQPLRLGVGVYLLLSCCCRIGMEVDFHWVLLGLDREVGVKSTDYKQPSTASLIKSAWFWVRVEAYLDYLVEDPSGSMLRVKLGESEHLQLLSNGEEKNSSPLHQDCTHSIQANTTVLVRILQRSRTDGMCVYRDWVSFVSEHHVECGLICIHNWRSKLLCFLERTFTRILIVIFSERWNFR